MDYLDRLIWGVDDEELFEGAKKELERLREAEKTLQAIAAKLGVSAKLMTDNDFLNEKLP